MSKRYALVVSLVIASTVSSVFLNGCGAPADPAAESIARVSAGNSAAVADIAAPAAKHSSRHGAKSRHLPKSATALR